MIWRFTIVDRDNVATVIEEPIGWDKNVSEIKRHPEWHGIFFNNQGETFQFDGLALEIIKAEKEKYGSEGNLTLIMEEDCGNGFEEFSRGRFDFNQYEIECGDECFVKIPVEKTGDVTDLTNRIDQKVNLETLKAFDEVTNLVPYSKLPFSLALPSKGVFLQNKAQLQNEQTTTANLQGVFWEGPERVDPFRSAYIWFQIVPQIEDITFSEFGRFTTAATPELNMFRSQWYSDGDDRRYTTIVNGNMNTPPDTRRLFFDWSSASPLLVNEGNGDSMDAVQSFSLEINYSFDISIHEQYTAFPSFITWYNNIVALYNVVMIRRKNGSYEFLAKERIISGLTGGFDGYDPNTIWKNGETHSVDFSGVFSDVTLNDGDYLFVTVIGLATSTVGMIARDYDIFNITSKSGSVKMETLSHFETTISKVFAVNEALSRVAETITNDKIRGYSEYFGRTDSQPYAIASDGCGALEVISDGLRIRRQENKTPGQTTIFSQSLQDLFNGLNPIHNIGMGIEPDPERQGYNRLRVEQSSFFYNRNVILNCTGIEKIRHTTNEKEIYSTFSFGYDKWEAEEYNGLDELLTKRTYRTTLSQVKNSLVKLSTFIGSGYSLEITRRKGNENTKDWRYDKDVFIICLKRGASSVFSIAFDDTGNLQVAVYGDDYSIARQYFVVGKTVTISSPLNSGTFTVTSVSNVPGNLAVTVTEATAHELVFASVTSSNVLAVELGNIINSKNIIEPSTVYNFRISPVRNAMRWLPTVLRSYEHFNADSKIIFTDGDGNYFASGEMADGNCKLENAAIAENATIDPTIFADSNDAKPTMKAERVVFDYPMSSSNYKTVEANPYGLIYYENDCEEGLGWIDTISYKPEEGLANFKLIPAATDEITGCVPVVVRGDGTLPGGWMNTPYSAVINLYGTGPFELKNVVKPSWLSFSFSGTTIYLSGTPTTTGKLSISFNVSNCDGDNDASFLGTIEIGADTCEAVVISGAPTLPDGYANTAYNYSFALAGDGPFRLSNIVKPEWMNIKSVGSNIVFSGTPDAEGTDVAVSFDISNCNGANTVPFSDTINVSTVCIPVQLLDSPLLPDGNLDVAYNYSISLSGTAPFELVNIVKPSWMTIEVSVSNIVFSGTPDAEGAGVAVSFDVENCTSDTVSFADTIDVTTGATPGGAVLLQVNDIDNDEQGVLDLIDSDTVEVEYLPGGKITFHVIKIDGGDANG